MLDYESPANMLKECQSAEAHAKKHLAAFPDIVQIMVGSYYRDDMKPLTPSSENYPYSYLANVKPRLIFNNPRFNCTQETSSLDSKQMISMSKFANAWAVKEKLQAALSPWLTNALLMRGVILTTFEDVDGDEDLPGDQMRRKMPRCHVIEMHRYFRDPVSTPAVKPRYKVHVWVRDLEDVKKMKGVNKAAVKNLIPDIDLEKLQRPNQRQGVSDMPSRFEVIAYEMWVPECNDYRTGDGRGQHGTIFTIAVGQKISDGGKVDRYNKNVGYLFPPRPYYGPKWGPYTELEFIGVPGQTYGTSPVCVVMQQVEEVNAHLAATADAAARMKHLIFVDAANDTLQVATQNSPDGSVIAIPNITKDSIIPALIGGPAPEQYQYNEVARNRLDRNLGMDSAQRGEPVSGDTATATNVAYETLNIRMNDLKRITAQAVKQIVNTAAWYAWESNNVVMKLGGNDAAEMGFKSGAAFMGGPQGGETLPEYDDSALELEPYSMEAVDEEKLAQQVMEAMGLIAQLAQEMQTAPWLGYDVILEQLGKLRKFDWLHEAINGEMFAEWMKEQVQQNIEKHQIEQAQIQAQIEGIQLDNAKKKVELMLMMQGPGEEKKGPSVSISYKDLPEDVKRQAESAAGFDPSTQPLTSPAHIQNQMKVMDTNSGRAHENNKMESTHTHQRKQSHLAGMFRTMSANKRGSSGMKSRSNRAQNGPMKTASKGQKAHAGSR